VSMDVVGVGLRLQMTYGDGTSFTTGWRAAVIWSGCRSLMNTPASVWP